MQNNIKEVPMERFKVEAYGIMNLDNKLKKQIKQEFHYFKNQILYNFIRYTKSQFKKIAFIF